NRLDAPGSPTESSLFQGCNELSSRAGQTGGIYPLRPARGTYKGDLSAFSCLGKQLEINIV
ncbi:MAG: hypothetical protein LBO79_04315, partial [Zoogloeaceae bacterium]|nr:hypothetical protein [Zoogloeaceae bacterium]